MRMKEKEGAERDEYFSFFIEKFGEATSHYNVPKESIDKWRGKLPEQLLHYWEAEGWNSYQNGLFSIVNPDDYEGTIDQWLENTPFEEMDSYHVFARDAFGVLYVVGEATGRNLTISCPLNTIFATKKKMKKKSADVLDREIKSFLTAKTPDSFDLEDKNDKSLFQRAVKKYGALADDEIFGFEPAIVAGGEMKLENIKKLDCFIHLMILKQLEETPFISEI